MMVVYQFSHLALRISQVGDKILQAPRLRRHFDCLFMNWWKSWMSASSSLDRRLPIELYRMLLRD